MMDEGALVEVTAPTLAASFTARVSLAQQQNDFPLLRELPVGNAGKTALAGFTLELAADPPFRAPRSWVIETVPPGAVVQLRDLSLAIDRAYLASLPESLADRSPAASPSSPAVTGRSWYAIPTGSMCWRRRNGAAPAMCRS